MLPSLNSLRAFEATVRTGSVRAAAADLNVVHGAVSQQIRALESQLGMLLFERRGRRLKLTLGGQRYWNAVSTAFAIIEKAGTEMKPGEATYVLRLGMRPAFAACWFIPRLPDLIAAELGIDVEVISAPFERNLQNTGLDALIIGGDYEPRPDVIGRRFMDDTFGPVAAPELAAIARAAGDVGVLSDMVGIVSSSTPELWERWFYESGHPAVRFRKRIVFDSVIQVIEAARVGLGVGIVPFPHVLRDVRDGRLEAPFGILNRMGGYHFCCRTNQAETWPYRRLLTWLVDQGQHCVPGPG